MMNETQMVETIMKHGNEIAELRESGKSAHKRIDENDRITEGIHKIASNVETLTFQVKQLAERLEDGLRSQGERIGALEKEPGAKWKGLVSQLISLSVAALFGVLMAKFL